MFELSMFNISFSAPSPEAFLLACLWLAVAVIKLAGAIVQWKAARSG